MNCKFEELYIILYLLGILFDNFEKVWLELSIGLFVFGSASCQSVKFMLITQPAWVHLKKSNGCNEASWGAPVAVLNGNQPVFYCVPADAYKVLMGKLEDIELADIVRQRQSSPEIEVSLN